MEVLGREAVTTLQRLVNFCAERVKVVVRLRPPFPHETGGAVVVNPEQNSISVFRE